MKKPTNKYKIDERNHVERPLLDQLRGLGWEVLDLGLEQKPQDSFRANFAEAVMLPVLREQLMVINPWLELDQVESVVKSPKVKDAIPEAIDQMLRYSEQRGARGEGNASLFYYNQIVVATCRQEAKFGTISTHTEKYFYRWADPYPRKLEELEHGTSSPNDQQRLIAGMFDHKNLLDLIRTFTLFSTNDKGEMIKIVGRYQQFRAVKLALDRLP